VIRDSFDKVRCNEIYSQRESIPFEHLAQRDADRSGCGCRSLGFDEIIKIINSRTGPCYLPDLPPGWLCIIAATKSGSEVGPCRRFERNSLPVEPGRMLDCRGNLVVAAKRQGKPWLSVEVTQQFFVAASSRRASARKLFRQALALFPGPEFRILKMMRREPGPNQEKIEHNWAWICPHPDDPGCSRRYPICQA
jgi:hypothetical protein